MLARFFMVSIAIAAASGQERQLEIDNQWVRVYRVKQAPHTRGSRYDHPDSVIVYLTDAHQRIVGPDGNAKKVDRKAGEVAFLKAGRQAEENISDQPIEMIFTELKDAKSTDPKVKLDPVKLDPKHHLVPLENTHVRVLRTILEPHLKSPMHEHPHYVVVYLTELHTTMKLGDGREVDNPRKAGDVAWRDFLKHETENIGEHRAEEIQIEIK